MMFCRHCEKGRATRPRGLCWTCYRALTVRHRYLSTSKFARRGAGLDVQRVQLPPFPTDALPGTPEKIAILEQRAQMRQELFHQDDATFAGPVRTPQRAG